MNPFVEDHTGIAAPDRHWISDNFQRLSALKQAGEI